MDKKMENDMETGMIEELTGIYKLGLPLWGVPLVRVGYIGIM